VVTEDLANVQTSSVAFGTMYHISSCIFILFFVLHGYELEIEIIYSHVRAPVMFH
jgi:hypothetical protein